jgi:hypothetical protein
MDNLAKALIKVWSKLKLSRCVAVRDVGNTEWLCLVSRMSMPFDGLSTQLIKPNDSWGIVS